MMMNFKTIINLSLAFSLVLPSFCFAQEQTSPMPQTIEEAESLGMRILTALPEAVKKVWREEALPFWQKMWAWAQGPWNSYIKPKVEFWWQRFLSLLGKETPDLEKEFQKERKEMEKDLWHRFRDLLK